MMIRLLPVLGIALFAAGVVKADAPVAPAVPTPQATTAAAPAATNNPEKQKAIRQLLDLTGAGKNGLQAVTQMLESQHDIHPEIPAEFWERFRKKITAQELAELSVPIYDRYFTTEEINGLIAFYQTPLGQKMVTTLPQVMQESMQAGQQWGRAKGEEVVREMQAEGKVPAKKPPAPAKPAAKGKTSGKPAGRR